MKIDEAKKCIVPVKLSADNLITVRSGPRGAYTTIDIDADVLTLGVAAKILTKRYEQHLRLFKLQGTVPADFNDQVDAMVDAYFACKRDEIVMIRKDGKNG